jgi:thiol-disulfide isomerase/thioredoxin
MRAVESADEFYERIRNGQSLVAAFQADWCGDCHFLRPSYPEIEERFSGRVEFVAIDTEALPDLARNHEISGIPSFILFSSGREVFRFVNPRRKTKEEVTDFLEKGLALVPGKEFS